LYKSVLSSCKLVDVEVVVGCVCAVEVEEVALLAVVLPRVQWTMFNQNNKFVSARFVDVASLW
jgi:hypothetical protein